MPETPVGASGQQDRAATRRMCAGVYLDAEYRTAVIQQVYNARKRRVAPSYGYDLVPVLAHAWRAWWLATAANALIVAVLGVAYAARPAAAFLATAVLVDLTLLVSFAARSSGRTGDGPPRAHARGLVAAALATVVAVAIVVATDGPRGFTVAAVIILVLCLVLATVSVLRQLALNGLRAGLEAERPLRMNRRLSVIDGQQRHPMVVYTAEVPFIGSGRRLGTWSFAQRLVETKGIGGEKDVEFTKKPFPTWDLVEELRRAITALGTEDDPETRLPGLMVTDSLFVEGRYAMGYARELTDTPNSDMVRRMLDSPTETARHYLTCRVESWGGDLVTTIFVHVSLQGRTLYIEFTTCGLAPTRLEYHAIDVVGRTGRMAVVRAAFTGLRNLPVVSLAPVRLLGAASLLLGSLGAAPDATAASLKRGNNIGAELSARELASIEADESYFQTFDVAKHSKVIERRLLATVGEFLREHGVDTTEFLQRATAILNNGVINTGSGNVELGDTAMGVNTSVSK
ncbi:MULTISPECIES: hypothetical protein [Streptomyces]|nr:MULTISPECIES: hypothetical protein [Streptomyces]MYY82222.1 hypothetical protein [Streptomyces sp. SID335]NDZ84181.1 hypothetical protein [Streptomyces sp. SID10115]NEA01117.1 hypothetical protein [Streptomyces sp. SID10116]NEB49772.1 hypothetical protein [Streptomyces sp. SID339]